MELREEDPNVTEIKRFILRIGHHQTWLYRHSLEIEVFRRTCWTSECVDKSQGHQHRQGTFLLYFMGFIQ